MEFIVTSCKIEFFMKVEDKSNGRFWGQMLPLNINVEDLPEDIKNNIKEICIEAYKANFYKNNLK